MSFESGNKISLSFEPSKDFFEPFLPITKLLPLLGLLLVLSSCAQSISENVQRGSDYMFRVGYPEVRMSAIGLFDQQGNAGINVSANVVYGSLVYKEVKNQQTANVTVETRIVKKDSENSETVVSESYQLTVSEKEKQNITSSQDFFTFNKRYEVPPGRYTVYLSVIDQSSNRHTTRETTTVIPSPSVQRPVLTDIQLLGKQNSEPEAGYQPITTYDVRSKIDSLKFRFQVTNNDPENSVTINSELVQFKSDTTHARPMSYPEPSPSSIEYQGIEYDEEQVIQSSRRVLSQTGSVLVEFNFPIQERGNYRFSARLEGEQEETFKARDFGIKSKNYPTIKTPRELARPLAYLMGEDEYQALISIQDSDSLKRAIDTFWLKNIGNKSKARQVISLYYQRVEEANKQFSNFKEGWKTDPGMMYILFGRPLYYDEYIDSMTWFYSYDRSDPRETFQFEKPTLKNSYFPFDHYILNRNFYYDNLEYQQRERWLSGLILNGST